MVGDSGAKVTKDKSGEVRRAIIKGAKRGLVKAADRIIEQAILRVPVRQSKLQASIDKKPVVVTPSDISIELGAYSPYAAPIEYGSAGRGEPDAPGKKARGPYPIRSKSGKALRFRGQDGKMIFRKKVMHPGVVPQPFFRPAIDAVAPSINEIIGSEIDKELRKAIGKTRD